MLSFLHRLSALSFAVLAGSFFLAYVLLRQESLGPWPAWWMQVADLPLLLCATMYAGSSLVRSLQHPTRRSAVLPSIVGIPLAALFSLFVILNFWNVW